MKKLYFNPQIGSVDITDPTFITLVIENKPFYWEFTNYLFNDFPDHQAYCSIETGKKEAIEDYSTFIAAPWDMSLNTKANINALYKILKKAYANELNASVEQIQKIMETIAKEIRLDFDAELHVEGTIRIDDIFKLGNIQFQDEEETFLGRLTRFVAVNRELRNIGLVFINHLRDFLDEESIKEFLKDAFYRGISIVDIETFDCNTLLEGERKIIVDPDFCFIS